MGHARVSERLKHFLDQPVLAFSRGCRGTWATAHPSAEAQFNSLSLNGVEDVVVVGGAEYPQAGGDPLARWLWTFDGTVRTVCGSLNSSTTCNASLPAQVLAVPSAKSS